MRPNILASPEIQGRRMIGKIWTPHATKTLLIWTANVLWKAQYQKQAGQLRILWRDVIPNTMACWEMDTNTHTHNKTYKQKRQADGSQKRRTNQGRLFFPRRNRVADVSTLERNIADVCFKPDVQARDYASSPGVIKAIKADTYTGQTYTLSKNSRFLLPKAGRINNALRTVHIQCSVGWVVQLWRDDIFKTQNISFLRFSVHTEDCHAHCVRVFQMHELNTCAEIWRDEPLLLTLLCYQSGEIIPLNSYIQTHLAVHGASHNMHSVFFLMML